MGFEKGNPGGPGRPKQKPFLEWCRKWTVEQAEIFLLPLAQSPGKQQLDAIKTIMAYGIGKPQESVEASHQFEGMDANPHQAKEFLGQLIAGSTIEGVGLGEGSGDVPPNESDAVLGSQRSAGESDSGSGKPGELHNGA